MASLLAFPRRAKSQSVGPPGERLMPIKPTRPDTDGRYPEPPDPSHDGPEPCDTPEIYRVEKLK